MPLPPRPRRLARTPQPSALAALAALATLLAATAGCFHDAASLTAPGPVAPTAASRPLTALAAGPSGTYALPVPATNTERYAAVAKTATGLSVASGAYALVEVTGRIAIGQNPKYLPYCAGTAGGCQTPYAGQTAGPAGTTPDGQLAVSVWATSPTDGEYRLDLAPKAGDPYTRVTAGRWRGGVTLAVERAGIVGGGGCSSPWDLTCPPGVGGQAESQEGAYTLSGAEEVRVTPIYPPTVAISAPAAGTASRTFTMSWPYVPASEVYWRFNPGDTGASPQNPALYYVPEVAACRGATTCTFEPPEPGRMYVQLGGAGIAEASGVSLPTNAAAPQLAFTCTPSTVVRGATVSCTASITPAAPFRVTTLQVTPAGPDGAHTDTVLVDVASGGSWTTAGEAALSTQLAVSAIAQFYGTSVPVFADAAFSVTPRSWAPLAPAGPPDSIASDLPSLLFSPNGAFGLNTAPGPDSIHISNYHQITTGPNAGFTLLDAPPVLPRSTIQLHTDLNGTGAWGSLQRGLGPNGHTAPSGLPYCDQAGLARFREFVRRHEGLTLADNSHEGDYRRLLVSEALHAKYERVVMYRPTYPQWRRRVTAVWGSFGAPLAAAARRLDAIDHDPTTLRNTIGCELVFPPYDTPTAP